PRGIRVGALLGRRTSRRCDLADRRRPPRRRAAGAAADPTGCADLERRASEPRRRTHGRVALPGDPHRYDRSPRGPLPRARRPGAACASGHRPAPLRGIRHLDAGARACRRGVRRRHRRRLARGRDRGRRPRRAPRVRPLVTRGCRRGGPLNLLVLFDIDGTLLLTHDEVYVEAARAALEEVYGTDADGPDVPGDTATAHVRRALLSSGFDSAQVEAGLDRWCRSFSERYVDLLAEADTRHWELAPHAAEAIAAVERRALLTGNPPAV